MQLVAEQTKLYGRPIATPDLVLVDGEVASRQIVVAGQRLMWLELKNFYGNGVPMLQKLAKKQTGRYLERYGPGALVFNAVRYATSLGLCAPHDRVPR